MTGQNDDWGRWQDAWRKSPPTGSVKQRQSHRRFRGGDIAQGAVALAAIALLAIALRHAASPFELALGVSVAAAILAVWFAHARARTSETSALTQDTTAHLAALRSIRLRELRLVRFIWIVLLLDGVFLAPWWIGGVEFHTGDLGSPIALLTLWLPIVAIVGLVAWTLQLRWRARADLLRIAQMERDFADA